MKYYLITFSDWSETIGKGPNKAAIQKDARMYCKLWRLAETVRDIQEITEEEYNKRLRK